MPNPFDPLKGINIVRPQKVQFPMQFGYGYDMNHTVPNKGGDKPVIVNPNSSVFERNPLEGDNGKPLFEQGGGLMTDYAKPNGLPRLPTNFDYVKPTNLPSGGHLDPLVGLAAKRVSDRADAEQLQNTFTNSKNNPSVTAPAATSTNPLVTQPQATSAVTSPANSPQTNTTNVNYDLYKNNNPIVQGTNLSARDYFGFIKSTDAASLLNNAMQAPPPTIQLPLTHLQRLRLDRTPIDNINTQQQEQQAASFRNLREGVTQGSDLMRGIEAISKQGNEAARQTGAMYGEMNNQEMQANNQIANQEQQIQDGQNQQEQMSNYDIQARAQAEKNAAITSNLTELKKDAMVEAQYNIQQQDQMRQQAYDKDYLDRDTKIKMLSLQHEASKDYNKSEQYQSGRLQHLNTNMANYHKEAAAGTQFEGSDWAQMADAPKAQKELADLILKDDTQLGEYNKNIQAEQAALDAMPDKTSAEYAKRKSELDAAQGQIATIKTRRNVLAGKKQHYDTYLGRLNGKYDQTGLSATYDQEYRKKNAILGQQEYIESLQKMALGK